MRKQSKKDFNVNFLPLLLRVLTMHCSSDAISPRQQLKPIELHACSICSYCYTHSTISVFFLPTKSFISCRSNTSYFVREIWCRLVIACSALNSPSSWARAGAIAMVECMHIYKLYMRTTVSMRRARIYVVRTHIL